MKKLPLLFLLISCSLSLFAQKIKYSKSFLQKLTQTEMDIFTPTEGKYKSTRPIKNAYQPIDHVIVSKQEGIEIRYAIIPFDEEDQTTQVPHVDFMRVVTSTATNEEEEAVISVHAVEDAELKEHFNADWGSMAYYQPKSRFSKYKHCRLLSLFTEGKGTVYVFFLFDEASRALDNRLHSIQFQTKI
ncbi:MAG: hypothetical protein AB8G86_13520 [Saprospiraceae bacterium]